MAFRKALVVAQVTLSLLLLIAAGLFIRSLNNLKTLDPGFNTRNLLTFTLDPPLNGYKPERSREFYRQLSEAMSSTPGVEAASLAVMPVLKGYEWDSSVTVESYAAKPGEFVDPHMNFVSPDHFRALNIPLLMGRDFNLRDDTGSPKVAIVNEKFARQYFADGNPIGRHIGMGSDPGTKTDIEVIGVVRDAKYETMRDEMPYEVYRPYRQMEFTLGMTAYVRTARRPEEMFPVFRNMVRQLDPDLPLADLKTLEMQMEESLLTERLVATLASAFGVLATVLACIGLYGVMAYSVTRRTREIGIRVALGAGGPNVIGLVMKEVAILAGIGIAIGLPTAVALTWLVRKQVYGVQPNDPVTLALAALCLTMVALAAGYLPARRALRIDPMRALRWE